MIKLTETMIESGWMKALGWTFVHSIWQIALIGLLLFIVLRLIPGRSAHVRYTISAMSLWMIVVTALCTFIIMLPQEEQITTQAGQVFLMTKTESHSTVQQLSYWLEQRIPMMLTIWLGGVAILMLRLALSLGYVHHIRYESFPDEELQHTLNGIITRIRLKIKATVAESYLIQSPVTIGHLKPLILFPVGIINQLNPKEVEAILTHELAHIVRRDYLSNLMQSFIETLFYYHPVTWWISRMVRTERENRADDLAVSWCGDHLGYAKALMAVQELQLHTKPSLSIGFASRKGAMLARIQRILHLPYKNHNQMEKTVLLSLCSLCFLAFTLTSHTNTVERKKEEAAWKTTYFAPIAEEAIVIDTIPSKGSYRIHKKTDDQDISIQVEDGDIIELKIDGKPIEPGAYSQYDVVISELFGGMAAPPVEVQGYYHSMPPVPGVPGMPLMPPVYGYHFEMPDMPDMPDMPRIAQFEMEDFMNGEFIEFLGDSGRIEIYNPRIKGKMRFAIDSLLQNEHEMIILGGGDTILCEKLFNHPHGEGHRIIVPGQHQMELFYLDENSMNGEEMKKWAEELQQNIARSRQDWKASEKDWKAQEEQWKEQSKQWEKQWKEEWKGNAEQWRQQAEAWKAQQDEWRAQQGQNEMEHELYRHDLEQLHGMHDLRDAERELEILVHPNRLSMSDAMVADGLIKPGEEVEVQLTPDKLKINGKKMDEELHQKYLRMYERQQGVELSGNSRVEFTTKSKMRM